MDRAVRRLAGFTLLEMLIALSLGALVIMAMAAMFGPALGTEISLVRAVHSQGDALLALKALGKDLAEASLVTEPVKLRIDSQGSTLAGCINYDAKIGGAIDPTQPVVGFRYCVVNGGLYRASAPTCPTLPSDCGPASVAVAANISPSPGSSGLFLRPAGAANVVQLHYVVTAGDQSQQIDTSYQFQGIP